MSTTLIRKIEHAGHPNVLVVGDLILDRYVWGDVDRISPEAPIQILRVASEERRPGGAGNVINNLHSLGAKVACCGVLGSDAEGEAFREVLQSIGVDDFGVVTDRDRRTTVKARMVARAQQVLRVDWEDTAKISESVEAKLLTYVRGCARDFDLVIVSDYAKGVVTEALMDELRSISSGKGCHVIVDPAKGADYHMYRGVATITPNRVEAEMAVGSRIVDEASLREAATTLLEEHALESALITRDKDGMSLFRKDGEELHLTAHAQAVFDVTGAGDAVISALGFVLAAGHSLEDAARIANIAGGIEVGKVGAVPVTKEEIINQLRDVEYTSASKIKSLEELRPIVRDQKGRGRKVVFTNGCFDVLHVGHVELLRAAKSFGDLLVVGMNSDSSVRRLKGPRRPILGEIERSHVLAALETVDYVVLFEEDTPEGLLREIRPDVLAKGSDYSKSEVVGREIVEEYGGEVRLIPVVPGISTSDIVARVLERHQEGAAAGS